MPVYSMSEESRSEIRRMLALSRKKQRYGDSFRERIWPEHVDEKYFSGSLSNYWNEIREHFTPEEENLSNTCSNFYDVIQPYFSRNSMVPPFVWDFKNGLYTACIAHVNAGADDFNSVHGTLCPSVLVAYEFQMKYFDFQNYCRMVCCASALSPDLTGKPFSFDGSDQTEAGVRYNAKRLVLNDLLYMYHEIKQSNRGINFDVVKKHQKWSVKNKFEIYSFGKKSILAVFKQMDELLNVPEKERFCFEDIKLTVIAKKVSFLDRLGMFLMQRDR